MKKTLSLILSLCMVALVAATAVVSVSADATDFDVWDGTTADTSWYDGSKTEYEISTAAQLAGLAKLTNDNTGPDAKNPGAFHGITFYITKNLDLAGKQWTPIGKSNNIAFAGLLEGKLNGETGKAVTIANMAIGTPDEPDGNKNIGLVGTQGGGGIKNVYLTGAYINTSNNTAGSFVGYSRPQSAGTPCEYSNLRSDATIITAGEKWCGGIVAYSNIADNVFKDCAFTGSITSISSSSVMVGGICGNTEKAASFENCYVSGEIKSEGKQVGGMVGYINPGLTVTFTDCHYDGTVCANSTQVGAFVGRQQNGDKVTTVTFDRCFNSGISKSSYKPAAAAISWIGLGGGYSDNATAWNTEYSFTGCYSLSDTSIMARVDFLADKSNTVYKIVVDGKTTEQSATGFDCFGELRVPTVSYDKYAGNAAKTNMSGLLYQTGKWTVRDATYPTLDIAAEVADAKYAIADMSWFNPTAEKYVIDSEYKVVGLAKIAKIYDFDGKTIEVADSVKNKLTTDLFTAEFIDMLSKVEVTTEATDTTDAPSDDTTTEKPDDVTTPAPADDTTTAGEKPSTKPPVTTAADKGEDKKGCGSISVVAVLAVVVISAVSCVAIIKKH